MSFLHQWNCSSLPSLQWGLGQGSRWCIAISEQARQWEGKTIYLRLPFKAMLSCGCSVTASLMNLACWGWGGGRLSIYCCIRLFRGRRSCFSEISFPRWAERGGFGWQCGCSSLLMRMCEQLVCAFHVTRPHAQSWLGCHILESSKTSFFSACVNITTIWIPDGEAHTKIIQI